MLNNKNMKEIISEEKKSSSLERPEDANSNSRFPRTARVFIPCVKLLTATVSLRASSANNESTYVCQVYLHHQVTRSMVVTQDSSPIFQEGSPPKSVLFLFLEKHMNLLRRNNLQ